MVHENNHIAAAKNDFLDLGLQQRRTDSPQPLQPPI
jgi:hypothetical protein